MPPSAPRSLCQPDERAAGLEADGIFHIVVLERIIQLGGGEPAVAPGIKLYVRVGLAVFGNEGLYEGCRTFGAVVRAVTQLGVEQVPRQAVVA